MVLRKVRSGDLGVYANILVSEAVPLGAPVPAPFTAHWCVVKPGATSERHMHREHEAFFIAQGQGIIDAEGETTEVEAGDTVVFDPLVHHTIHNPPGGGEDLVFVTVYWADEVRREQAKASANRQRQPPVLAFATPATPNGDLHLGHLAGPYLAGDIWTRYLRSRGVKAWFVTGSDDHQTYVEHKRRQLKLPVEETAAMFSARIAEALDAANVRLDLFVRTADSVAHQRRTAAFFTRLYETGRLRRQLAPTLYCERCKRHLFEVYVRGGCPHCGATTSGNGCEACGRPNECVDLMDPTCNICGNRPVAGSQERVVFPLEDHRQRLHDFVDRASMSTHLRTLCSRMLADELPAVSVTHESDWGIPVPVPGFDGQVIWSWLEIAALYLGVADELGTRNGWDLRSQSFLSSSDLEVVQFFGFDNGYFKAIFLTALYLATQDDARLPSRFITNEFYRLDGRKFSTSANHVVTVLDATKSAPSDVVRFYLCYTRPELVETNYVRTDFAETVRRLLVDGWQKWLHALGRRVDEHCGGTAPDTGLWTEQHAAFEADLLSWCRRAEGHLSAASFSPARLVRLLAEMVDEASQFGASEALWAHVPGKSDNLRTALALELAAARALAIMSSPIMPQFAAQLWDDLGGSPSLAEHGWAGVGAYIEPGTTIRLDRTYFATP